MRSSALLLSFVLVKAGSLNPEKIYLLFLFVLLLCGDSWFACTLKEYVMTYSTSFFNVNLGRKGVLFLALFEKVLFLN